MVPRSKAVIQNVKGLTLKVEPLVDPVPLEDAEKSESKENNENKKKEKD
jgi:hypothetical protein